MTATAADADINVSELFGQYFSDIAVNWIATLSFALLALLLRPLAKGFRALTLSRADAKAPRRLDNLTAMRQEHAAILAMPSFTRRKWSPRLVELEREIAEESRAYVATLIRGNDERAHVRAGVGDLLGLLFIPVGLAMGLALWLFLVTLGVNNHWASAAGYTLTTVVAIWAAVLALRGVMLVGRGWDLRRARLVAAGAAPSIAAASLKIDNVGLLWLLASILTLGGAANIIDFYFLQAP